VIIRSGFITNLLAISLPWSEDSINDLRVIPDMMHRRMQLERALPDLNSGWLGEEGRQATP
jgi:hypothetical protein